MDDKFSNAAFTSSAVASARIWVVVSPSWVSLKYPIIGLMPFTAPWCSSPFPKIIMSPSSKALKLTLTGSRLPSFSEKSTNTTFPAMLQIVVTESSRFATETGSPNKIDNLEATLSISSSNSTVVV